MTNHIHIVLGVQGDPDPEVLIGTLKSYGSWALNRLWTKPINGSWWSGGSGSKRRLKDQDGIERVLQYIRQQHQPGALAGVSPRRNRVVQVYFRFGNGRRFAARLNHVVQAVSELQVSSGG